MAVVVLAATACAISAVGHLYRGETAAGVFVAACGVAMVVIGIVDWRKRHGR